MKRFSAISSMLFAALLFGGALSVNAQEAERCSLRLEVVADGSSDAVLGITGKAISVDAEEIIEGVVDGNSLTFNGLMSGAGYSFVIKKPEYKRTLVNQVIRCSPKMAGTASMMRGNPKDTFNSIGRFYGAFKIANMAATEQGGTGGESTMPPTDTPRVPRSVSKGVVNGSATSLPKPVYPPEAYAAGAKGAVNVQVTIDEEGNVIEAATISGHELLRASSESAARRAKFKPTIIGGNPVRVHGVIVYNYQ